jgi:RES domain-containing protein
VRSSASAIRASSTGEISPASGEPCARSFDGGYGLLYDGRWNTAGHAVTYCATSPSLCLLESGSPFNSTRSARAACNVAAVPF